MDAVRRQRKSMMVRRRNQGLQRRERRRTERSFLTAHHRQPLLPCAGSVEEAASSHPAGTFFNKQGRGMKIDPAVANAMTLFIPSVVTLAACDVL
jgi:hypothetical protein